MFNEPVVYVDVETTGIGYRTSRIIEFAAIRVENGSVTNVFKTLINPGVPIPYHISSIAGISDEDVYDAPYFNEVAEQISSILNGAIFIAHNVRFDYSFIKRQLELCNISYSPRMLCSVRLSRALYPNEKGHGLEAIIKRFGIKTVARHRAYEDAEAVMKFLAIAYAEHGYDNFNEAISKQLKHRSAPPNVKVGAFDNIPNTTGVYTFKDESGNPIYIGKSVSLRKRIMSHFAQDTAIDKEMKLSLHTHHISFTETANELEALLLESQMVKEMLPLYNRQLRRTKKMYVLLSEETAGGYRSVAMDYVDAEAIKPCESIFGVYASRMKARRGLELIQKTYDLCPKLLGLEKTSRACFNSQLGKCGGACYGNETFENYNKRFEIAFQRNRLMTWPYTQPIVVSHINNNKSSKNLVLDNWSVIGEIKSEEGCETVFRPWKTVFDMDSYKIIKQYLSAKSAHLKLAPISYSELEQLSI